MALGTSLYTRIAQSTGSVVPLDTATEIADFLVNANNGEIGEIASGIYNAPPGSSNDRWTLTGNSGSALAPITLRAAAGATVQLRSVAASPKEVFVITGGTQYWRFENIIFENSGADGAHNWGPLYFATCSDIETYGCTTRFAAEGSGLFVEEDCPRIHLINHRSYGNNPTVAQEQSHGMYITGDDCMVLNSIVYSQEGYGFQVRSNEVFGAQNIIIANSLAYNFKGTINPGTEFAGFVIDGSDCDGAQLWNNISYDNRNGFRGITAGTPSPINVARKNIANANDSTQYGRQTGTTALDYSSNGSGDYVGPGDNLTSDPLLVDPANGNFRISAGSPAIGYGNEAFCPTFDFTGATRTQVDAGPYAFSTAAAGGIRSRRSGGRRR